MGAWGEGTLHRSTAANQSVLPCLSGTLAVAAVVGPVMCPGVCVQGGRGGKFWKVLELPALVRTEEPGQNPRSRRTKSTKGPALLVSPCPAHNSQVKLITSAQHCSPQILAKSGQKCRGQEPGTTAAVWRSPATLAGLTTNVCAHPRLPHSDPRGSHQGVTAVPWGLYLWGP